MSTLETNPNGVWTQIVAATPRPEVEELAKIIGKRLIDTNEVLACLPVCVCVCVVCVCDFSLVL
jgi:hypothetical protein